jgi:hypothetical protein
MKTMQFPEVIALIHEEKKPRWIKFLRVTLKLILSLIFVAFVMASMLLVVAGCAVILVGYVFVKIVRAFFLR